MHLPGPLTPVKPPGLVLEGIQHDLTNQFINQISLD